MSDPLYWLMLSQLPLSRLQKQQLLDAYSSPEHIFSEPDALAKIKQLCHTKHKHLPPLDLIQDEAIKRLSILEGLGWQLLTPSMHSFPKSLLQIPDPPLLLYIKGDPAALCQPLIAIVGSRKATPLGMKMAQRFAAQLSGWGLGIVSGLARGIDSAAHEGALESTSKGLFEAAAPTSAILANGPGTIYPRQNISLSDRIVASGGGLLTENPPGTPLKPYLFPERNRLISGLSVGTLVIEADLKSGSLVTAKQALSQGRDVFAVPGAITNPQSRGCHQLIKQGAMLVETPDDIINALHSQLRELCPGIKSCVSDCEGTSDPLLNVLSAQPLSLNEIGALSGMPVSELQVKLARLELSGLLVRQSGRYFRSR